MCQPLDHGPVSSGAIDSNRPVSSLPRDCCCQAPQSGWLNTTEMSFLTVLGATRPKARCRRGRTPRAASAGGPSLSSGSVCGPTRGLVCGRWPPSLWVSVSSRRPHGISHPHPPAAMSEQFRLTVSKPAKTLGPSKVATALGAGLRRPFFGWWGRVHNSTGRNENWS